MFTFVLLLFADPLGDVASTDNIIDDVSSAAEDVDYDKLFDENLLKQAYESKKKDSSEVDRDSTDDEGAAEENRVSSSQETVKKMATKRQKTPTKEQEKLSDFAGEVVFREDLKSPSRKLEYDEEDSEDKRPLAKRSKQDLESSPDEENPSEKERKHEEAFLKYYQALRSNLQVWVYSCLYMLQKLKYSHLDLKTDQQYSSNLSLIGLFKALSLYG